MELRICYTHQDTIPQYNYHHEDEEESVRQPGEKSLHLVVWLEKEYVYRVESKKLQNYEGYKKQQYHNSVHAEEIMLSCAPFPSKEQQDGGDAQSNCNAGEESRNDNANYPHHLFMQ